MTWTLDELVGRAAEALADVRVANGRVTGLPDGRLVRWYGTIGLVDRPLPGPGRSARYGPRHLLQLVAVKRLQAHGHPLVEIQERLTGATDATLRAIADLPTVIDVASTSVAPAEPADHGSAADSGRFWLAKPAPDPPPIQPVAPVRPGVAPPDGVRRLHGVRVEGLTLLLSAPPDAGDLDAIAAAARPLLDLLAAKGLITTEGEPS